MDCGLLGEILSSIQQVIYTLALNSEYIRGRIPQEVRENNTLVAVGTFSSSFGIRLKSQELCNIFGATEISPTLKMLSELLTSKDDEEKLKNLLQNHSRATLFSYRQLMKTLIQSDTEFNIKLASPNHYFSNVFFSTDDIIRNFDLLQGEIKDIVDVENRYGTMVGINTEKKTFAFVSIDDENIIGKLSDNFKDFVFEIPKQLMATIETRITFKELIGNEKKICTLLSISDELPKQNEGEEI